MSNLFRAPVRPVIACLAGALLLSGCARWTDGIIYRPSRGLSLTPGSVGLTYEDVRFAAADGTEIHGWWIPGTRPGPVILFFHDNAGNLSDRVDLLRRIAERLGLGILALDYRGYGQSSGRPSNEGLKADAHGARSLVRQRGWDTRGVVLYGRGLGAAVALASAVESPPDGLVLEAAFTKIEDMARLHFPVLSWPFIGHLRGRWDNLDAVTRVRCPVLFLHGDRDTRVPIGMGWRLYDLCPEPKWFRTVPGAGHDDPAFVGGDTYWDAWVGFLERLAAERTASAAAGPGG